MEIPGQCWQNRPDPLESHLGTLSHHLGHPDDELQFRNRQLPITIHNSSDGSDKAVLNLSLIVGELKHTGYITRILYYIIIYHIFGVKSIRSIKRNDNFLEEKNFGIKKGKEILCSSFFLLWPIVVHRGTGKNIYRKN